MKRFSKRFAAIWLASTMVAVPEAGAAEDITDFLHKNWYEIEFFVFERPQVLDFNTQESLTVTAPRAFPVNIQALRPGPNGYQTYVDPLTRLCLTFPTLRYRLLPEEEIPEPEGEAPSMPVPHIAPELSADPRLDLMAAMAAFEAELDRSSDRWLASDSFLLSREARLVERRGVGRLLYHGRWIQAVPPRTAPQPILIQAGRKLNRPGTIHELEGTVAVTLGRFLHFEVNLFFHAPALGMDPVAIALSPGGEQQIMVGHQTDTSGYLQIKESRRMRSTEIHYLDHPKLGLVVRIDPVVIPEPLVESFENLEENAE